MKTPYILLTLSITLISLHVKAWTTTTRINAHHPFRNSYRRKSTSQLRYKQDEDKILKDISMKGSSSISSQKYDGSNWEKEHDLLLDGNRTKHPLKILLLDNYDSYTYNIYQHLQTLTSYEVIVVKNDEFADYSQLQKFFLASNKWSSSNDTHDGLLLPDCIVVGPGPGNPSTPSDLGVCMEVCL